MVSSTYISCEMGIGVDNCVNPYKFKNQEASLSQWFVLWSQSIKLVTAVSTELGIIGDKRSERVRIKKIQGKEKSITYLPHDWLANQFNSK